MKKALSVLLTAAMAASMMAGCGSSSDGAASGTTTDNGAAAGTESAGAAAADGAAFKIGGIGPTTGAAAIYGTAVMNGAQIAVDEINAAGGINGYQIAYKFEDDQHDAEKSVNAYNSLKDWGMQMLMGTVTTTPCVAVVEKTAEDGMYELTPSASSTDVIDNDNVFQVCFTDPNQGTASAQYIGENKLAAKVAVIYDSSDVYSSGIEANFVKEAQNQGLEVVAEEAFTADSKTDFSTQLQKAQSAGAELVFLPIYYTEASIILTQADSMGYAPTFFGCDGLDGLLGVENFNTELAAVSYTHLDRFFRLWTRLEEHSFADGSFLSYDLAEGRFSRRLRCAGCSSGEEAGGAIAGYIRLMDAVMQVYFGALPAGQRAAASAAAEQFAGALTEEVAGV